MNSVAVRLYVVVGIILTASGISHLLRAAAEPPEVVVPDWSVHDLPMQLGKWHGEDTEMDPKIAAATGAFAIANRIYRDGAGRAVSMHSAMFEDPAEGVYHSPLNCYRANGWVKLNETQEDMKVFEDLTIPISVTTWEKDNQKIVVAYWYQLGQHILYGRLDLGTVRWSLRGQPQWPALIKVMLQAPMLASEDSKETLIGFGKKLSEWLNSPEHRKYLDRWGGI